MTISKGLPQLRLRGRVFLLPAIVGLGLLLSACGSPSSTGTIDGRLLAFGGISTSLKGQPLAGHVKAMSSKGKSFATAVSKDGIFVLHVPMGTYSLSGSSPQFGGGRYECLGRIKVTVSMGTVTKDNVVCPEK
jgi:hypothetical protein